ncbi:MAG: sortase [Candidatus Saccharibacteria bacterium]
MKPNQPDNGQIIPPPPIQGPDLKTSSERSYLQNNEAAAQIIRSQIDNLYAGQATTTTSQIAITPDKATPIADIDPYQRTHVEHPAIQNVEWKKYHTAWQDYYQKYYEGYYKHHVKLAAQQQVINTQTEKLSPAEKKSYFSHNPEPTTATTDEEIMFDLRQRLIGKVKESATKVKKSRHFWPLISGLIAVLILLFVQYNQVLVSNVVAYVSPGNIDPQNIVISPITDISVSPDPKLIIPKINIDVPVVYDIGNDYKSQMAAMANGLAHFVIPGASSHPGQIGNTVLAGHSSNDLFDGGDYKFVFAQLDRLNIGDTIYANYNSKRYTYTVTKKETVNPNDVSKLVYPTTKPILTLLTCTPLGTAKYRLFVTAEQISPDPSQSTVAPNSDTTSVATIPGNSPTLIERLFGAN